MESGTRMLRGTFFDVALRFNAAAWMHERQFPDSNVADEKIEEVKCVHCGQHGMPKTACNYCGAPID